MIIMITIMMMIGACRLRVTTTDDGHDDHVLMIMKPTVTSPLSPHWWPQWSLPAVATRVTAPSCCHATSRHASLATAAQ